MANHSTHSGTHGPGRLRIGRRTLGVALVGAAISPLLAPWQARAQQSPPIQPRDQTPVADDDQVIEPEIQPTISPAQDAATVIDLVEAGETRYFAETGHNLAEPFLSAWSIAGGLNGPGQPLSEQRYSDADGGIRQDFSALALVYNPDEGARGTIRGVPLPLPVATSINPAAGRSGPGVCDAGVERCEVSPVTGHTVAGDIAAFWMAHGGAQLLGAPISEPVVRGSVTSQVFANVVIDRATNGQVSMRPVNAEVVATAMVNDAAFAPVPPTNGTSWLVRSAGGLNLRDAPNASSSIIATLPDNAEFIAVTGEQGAWVPGYVDGFAGWVSRDFLVEGPVPDAPSVVAMGNWRLDVWEGITLGETNIRREPTTTSSIVRSIEGAAPVVVTGWVRGEAVADNQITWAELEGGGFVYARNLRRAAPVTPPPLPPDAPSQGRWIDLHLTQQLMVAYEGRTPVRTVVTTTGMPGWETPPGRYTINTRVANETMESGAIGAEHFYVLKDVLFTQYFTDRGHALHYAWWKSTETIGRPGSHGCLNLLLEDARFFWDWATIGTPVICRTESA